MNYPDSVARFYDVVYHQLRTIDESYYLRKIKEAHGPVLEIGSGTGRLFVEALNAGADIYGVDANESMMNILKSKLDAKHHASVFLQDATQLHLDKKFDLIIAPFRMFSHLVKVDEQLAVLNRVYDHLNDGGTFIFDLFVPNPDAIKNGIKDTIDFDGEYAPGKKLKRIVSARPDFIEQISHVTMKYIWDEDGGEKSEAWNFPMRYFFRYEIEHLIARSKLHLEKIYGDFQEHELTNESKDFVLVCRK